MSLTPDLPQRAHDDGTPCEPSWFHLRASHHRAATNTAVRGAQRPGSVGARASSQFGSSAGGPGARQPSTTGRPGGGRCRSPSARGSWSSLSGRDMRRSGYAASTAAFMPVALGSGPPGIAAMRPPPEVRKGRGESGWARAFSARPNWQVNELVAGRSRPQRAPPGGRSMGTRKWEAPNARARCPNRRLLVHRWAYLRLERPTDDPTRERCRPRFPLDPLEARAVARPRPVRTSTLPRPGVASSGADDPTRFLEEDPWTQHSTGGACSSWQGLARHPSQEQLS